MSDQPAETGSSWRVVGLLAAVLCVASLLPVPFRRHPEFRRVGPDKLLHLVGYGAFAASIANALSGDRFGHREAGVLAISVSTGYALAIGLLQERVPGRAHEFADIGAGLLGAVLGVFWSITPQRSGHDRYMPCMQHTRFYYLLEKSVVAVQDTRPVFGTLLLSDIG